jgi:hypothetical protein
MSHPSFRGNAVALHVAFLPFVFVHEGHAAALRPKVAASAAAFVRPAHLAHESVTSGAQVLRSADAFFPAVCIWSFDAAPRGLNGGTCDVGNNKDMLARTASENRIASS